MRAGGEHVDNVQGLAGDHEEAVALGAAKANVGAIFGQPDDADGVAVGGEDLDAGAGSGPDVAVDVAAHAVGGRGSIAAGDGELGEALAVADGFAVEVPDLDFAAGAGVADINLL